MRSEKLKGKDVSKDVGRPMFSLSCFPAAKPRELVRLQSPRSNCSGKGGLHTSTLECSVGLMFSAQLGPASLFSILGLIPGLEPTPVFLPEESHGQRSLAGYSPWGSKELDYESLFS